MKSRAAGIAAIFLAGAYYWYFLHSPAPVPFAMDIAEIRGLANIVPGPHPKEIRVERIADFEFPPAAVITGGSLISKETGWASAYQLVYDDHTVIIDTAMNGDTGKQMGSVSATYQDAFDRMTKALPAAKLILLTHEHPDHIGGLAAYSELETLMKSGTVQLTAEQLKDPDRMLPVHFPAAGLNGYKPLTYDRVHGIAPGIVLIKAPGHSPGSQMIYVHLDSGSEYLFTGDVAWFHRNIDQVQGRPQLIGNMIHEDRAPVLGQLQVLRNLAAKEPNLNIVPGHDGVVIQTLIAQKRMTSHF